MELDRYLSALLQRWYVVVALAAVGFITAWLYFQTSGTETASTTVGVLDPAITQSVTTGSVAASGQAQLTFGSVIQSRALAQRVIQKLGLNMPAEAMQGKISVKLAVSAVPNVTPLYTIQVKDHDPARAVLYANTVVDEGKQLFAELNKGESLPVNDALTGQEQQAQKDAATARSEVQTQLSQAEAELQRLRRLMPTYASLTFDRDQASATVNQLVLRENDLQPQGPSPSLTAVRSAKSEAIANLQTARQALSKFQQDNAVDDLNTNIAAQNTLVNGLRGELQGVTPSTGALRTAEDRMNTIASRKLDLAVTDSGTSSVQVKVLDSAFLVRNTLFLVLVHILAVLLGVFAGLTVTYLFEYFDRVPRTAEDAAALIGAPVLIRMPEAS